MRVATLNLSVLPSDLTFLEVKVKDSKGVQVSCLGPDLSDVKKLNAELEEIEYSGDAAQRARILRPYVDELMPSPFAGWFRQWIASADDDSVLCVHADDPHLSLLPWNEILLPSDVSAGRGWVVRVPSLKGNKPPEAPYNAHMLLAGWARLTGYTMTGVVRELQEFPSKVDKRRVTLDVLTEPTRKQLLAAASHKGVSWLHLSPPSLIRAGRDRAIPVSKDNGKRKTRTRQSSSGPDFDSVTIGEFCRALKRNRDLRMVLLNACSSGIAGCGEISRSLGTVAIGWPALVADDIASDFTFFFYQRLVEGFSPAMAVRSFVRAIGTPRTPVEVPVVWLPSPKWVDWCPLSRGKDEKEADKPSRPSRARRSSGARKAGTGVEKPSLDTVLVESVLVPPAAPAPMPDPAEIAPVALAGGLSSTTLDFRPRTAINPALLVNGLHPIEHIKIESPVDREVHLCILCDTGADRSTYRQTVRLRKGVVPVTTTEIHFPALHELIERHAHRRTISFTATLISMEGKEIAGQTRTALWMGAKEWLDQEDTWAFIPAFVNPFDSGVLRVFDSAKKVLRTLGNPSDTYTGYGGTSPSAKYVSTQMKAIFQALRDDANITYISPPGSPVFDSSSQRAVGQVVRTHAEVIEQRLGTCHDLALLIAACAEYVGIRPIIGLIPMHTFVGFWTSAQAHAKYWKNRQKRLRTSKFGEGWTITDSEELWALVQKSQLALVEPTYVCQPEKSFDEACSVRKERFEKVDRELLDVVIDIYAARREVQPV